MDDIKVQHSPFILSSQWIFSDIHSRKWKFICWVSFKGFIIQFYTNCVSVRYYFYCILFMHWSQYQHLIINLIFNMLLMYLIHRYILKPLSFSNYYSSSTTLNDPLMGSGFLSGEGYLWWWWISNQNFLQKTF